MKRSLLLLVAVSAFAGSVLAGGRTLLSEDFSQSALFAERWESVRKGKNAAVCEDGRVLLPAGGGIRWTGQLPLDVTCEAVLRFSPDEVGKEGPRRAGFTTDYGIFHIYGRGGVAVITHKPARGGRYAAVPGFVPGQPIVLSLTRMKAGATMKYVCRVNGELITTTTAPVPEKPVPLEITAFNLSCEVLSVKVSELTGDGASPNMIVNSGFEYDEDGLPPFMQILGVFDWLKRPWSEYETKYLKRVSVDSRERHTGKKSLRLVADCGR